MSKKALIKSPLNYTGGKYRLLKQLLPLFPDGCSSAYDIFCGGCDVGINLNYDRVIINDSNKDLIRLLNVLRETSSAAIKDELFSLIEKYQLSRTDQYGYSYYGCNSSDGLATYNKRFYHRLRDDYNASKSEGEDQSLLFYLLIVFAFNNQIRFNSKGEYNLPVGKRDFNLRMQNKLTRFIDELQSERFEISNKCFRDMQIESMPSDAVVYADPPYLVTCATYNENNAWTLIDELDLLDYLDGVHYSGRKFILSNVLESEGKKNEPLLEWLGKNHEIYHINKMSMDYSNSNYQKKKTGAKTQEIAITNFIPQLGVGNAKALVGINYS